MPANPDKWEDNGHVLITPEECRAKELEEAQRSYGPNRDSMIYDRMEHHDRTCNVCVGGLAVCKICGGGEAQLDEDCLTRQNRKGLHVTPMLDRLKQQPETVVEARPEDLPAFHTTEALKDGVMGVPPEGFNNPCAELPEPEIFPMFETSSYKYEKVETTSGRFDGDPVHYRRTVRWYTNYATQKMLQIDGPYWEEYRPDVNTVGTYAGIFKHWYNVVGPRAENLETKFQRALAKKGNS